jgi:hypothetical protein
VEFLILDACVLIDYCESDVSVLQAIARCIGPIHVAQPVFDEVDQLDAQKAENLGLRVVIPELEDALAAASSSGALSFQDQLCLRIAKRNGWTCVSNDKRLRAECAANGVSVYWGLELIVLTVEAGGLSPKHAERVGTAIADGNRQIGGVVLTRFIARIAKMMR